MEPKKNYTDIHRLLERSQTLMTWKAPLRAYQKPGKYTLRFFLALALILSVIVFFFGDLILLVPIWAVLFLFYVLTTTPPPEVDNKLTKFGVETGGVRVQWQNLAYFYFTHRFNSEILTIVTQPPYNLHMYLVIPNDSIKEKAAYILGERISFVERPPRTLTDRLIDLSSHLVPSEEDDKKEEQQKKQRTETAFTNAGVHQTPAPATP